MKKYDSDALSAAFDTFLSDVKELADAAGYAVVTEVDDMSDALSLELEPMYDDIPVIDIEMVQDKHGDWEFKVKVSFPDIELDSDVDNLADLIADWESAGKLADELNSIVFAPDYWIENN